MADVRVTTNVTLNAQTVDVTVYEDIDNTGTTDNSQTVTGVAGGTNTYTLGNLEGGPQNAYWCKVSLSGSATTSPVVHSVTVEVPVSGNKVLLSPTAEVRTTTGILDTE